MEDKLIAAINEKNIDVVKSLIEQGIELNFSNKYFFSEGTLLHQCIFRCGFDAEYTEIATLLIENGANVEARDKYGNTPLFIAVNYFALDMLNILIRKGGQINEKNYNEDDIFDIVLESFNREMELDEVHNDISEKGEVSKRLYARIEAVIKNGYDINSSGFKKVADISKNLSAIVKFTQKVFDKIGK